MRHPSGRLTAPEAPAHLASGTATWCHGRTARPRGGPVHVDFPIISADSHITEAPNTYLDYIDPAYADVAPRIVETEDKGDVYVIDGMKRSIPMGLVAAAGVAADDLNPRARYKDLHKSGYDA